MATDAGGGVISQMRYYPYGGTRTGDMETDRRYTEQRLEAGTGLYDYNARYYDPALNRFIQADTLVPEPGNPQALNRYMYVLGNPLRYTDPNGHFPIVGPIIFGIIVGVGVWLATPEPVHAPDIDDAPLDVGPKPPDAYGVRLEYSWGAIPDILTGIDFNLDLVFNMCDPETGERMVFPDVLVDRFEERFNVYLSVNAQALVLGSGFSGGYLRFWNLPNNDGLAGFQVEGQGTIKIPLGWEGEVCYSPPLSGSDAGSWMLYDGPGAGEEIGLGLGVGYAWDVTWFFEHFFKAVVE